MTTEQALEIITTFRIHATDDEVRDAMQIAIDALTWIPVSERLPKNGQCDCIILDKDGFRAEAEFMGDHWEQYRWSCKRSLNEVTHWKPLPQPPKEEK